MIGGDNIFNLIFKLTNEQYDYNSRINIQMPYSIGQILGYELNNLTDDSIYVSDNVGLYQTEDVIYLNRYDNSKRKFIDKIPEKWSELSVEQV